jgi:hypothetical protein
MPLSYARVGSAQGAAHSFLAFHPERPVCLRTVGSVDLYVIE